MFCTRCGNKMADDAKFCTGCGAQTGSTNEGNISNLEQTAPAKGALVGFSPKINDPAFEKHLKSSRKGAVVFALVLAAVAIIGFPVYGIASGEMEFLHSLLYGTGIGMMFVIIALVQVKRQMSDKTWDGVVIDKKRTTRQVPVDQEQGNYTTEYVYNLIIRKANGKTKTDKYYNDPTIYDYYNIGDSVRHHKGMPFFEKYDKSRDGNIVCVFCGTMNSINYKDCRKCKLPLLN